MGDLFKDDLYLKEYKSYEISLMKDLKDKGSFKVLSKVNVINLEIEGQPNICPIHLEPEKSGAPYSFVKGELLLAAIKTEVASIWPSTKSNCFGITNIDGNLIDPRS